MSDEYESVEEEVEEVEEDSDDEAPTKKKRREKKWKVRYQRKYPSKDRMRSCPNHHRLLTYSQNLSLFKGSLQAQAGHVCLLPLLSGQPFSGEDRQSRGQFR